MFDIADSEFSRSFEQLVGFLREKNVIALSKACLQRFHLVSTFRHGSPSQALAPEQVNIRVFLAASMIAYYPDNVFESMGALEKDLYASAVPLLEKFSKMCTAIEVSESKSFFDVHFKVTGDV